MINDCDGAPDVRLVVVEDSPARRAALTTSLGGDGLRIQGFADGPGSAVEAVRRLRPQVVTVSLEMQGGAGQSSIEALMANAPVPILVFSGAADGPASLAAMEALGAGALDVVPWPPRWEHEQVEDLRRRVRSLHGITVLHHPRGNRRPSRRPERRSSCVALAASTGGPPALAAVLAGLRNVTVPVLVVQHLHADFLEGFVRWMARASAMPVKMAADGVAPIAGVVHVAPAGRHLRLGTDGRLHLSVLPARLHRPSADELFESMATACGAAGIGVVLSGMGDDGAEGLLALHAAGGSTLAQDEQTSAVWGMPQAAWRRGAVKQLLPLDQIADAVRQRLGP
ncbi:MAG: chemotaxis response regulator protein-glutamate methylesterase [Acidimicrobiales bacterium]